MCHILGTKSLIFPFAAEFCPFEKEKKDTGMTSPLNRSYEILINCISVPIISNKCHQNPTHSKRVISRKSGTDRHTHPQTDTHTQIKFVGVYSLQSSDCDDEVWVLGKRKCRT